MWCACIGLPYEWISPLEFLKSFRWSISSISIYYAPESDFRVTSYDLLNFSRASVVRFRVSRYIMRLNRTSEWKVMTIWISWELLLFIFKRLDISWASSIHPSQKLWPSDIAESFRVQFQASPYIVRLNRTSKWKVMTIWITREHSLFHFERLDILCTRIGLPFDKLWPFEFLENFRCSISRVLI